MKSEPGEAFISAPQVLRARTSDFLKLTKPEVYISGFVYDICGFLRGGS